MPDHPIFTIGHSNRDLDVFFGLLDEHEIRLIIDVRKLPGSNRYPQFNADTLQQSLGAHSTELMRLEPLTGRRLVSKTVPFDTNAWWQNRSFHNYADHALSPEFRGALQQLRTLAMQQRAAIMCSEAVWWRCHRRIIADYLLAAGEEVHHILGLGQTRSAELSAGAVIGEHGSAVTYPATEEGY